MVLNYRIEGGVVIIQLPIAATQEYVLRNLVDETQ